MSELLPCPFCGSEAEQCCDDDGDFYISCTGERCPGYAEQSLWKHTAEAEAVASWNRRATPKAAAQGAEAVAWMTVTKSGHREARVTYDPAPDLLRDLDRSYPADAPHRQVPLYTAAPAPAAGVVEGLQDRLNGFSIWDVPPELKGLHKLASDAIAQLKLTERPVPPTLEGGKKTDED